MLIFSIASLLEFFCSIKIDGCVDRTQTRKCDYLFVRCRLEHFYFVELKGSDISGAYKQIVSSIKSIQPKIDLRKEGEKKKVRLENKSVFGVIALRSVPRPQLLKVNRLKEKFRKDVGMELMISERGVDI